MFTLDKLKELIPSAYVNKNMRISQDCWTEWYKGETKLHRITINNGINIRTREITTLKMAARVAEDLVASILSENWTIEVTSAKGKSIQKKTSSLIQGSTGEKGILGTSGFKDILNDTLERTFALGSGAVTISLENIGVDENGVIIKNQDTRVSFNSYIAQEIIPITYKNGIISEAAFISEITYKGKKANVLTSYIKDAEGIYQITNRVFDGDREIDPQEVGLISYINTQSKRPWFFVFTTSKANKIDFNSPLGESVFSDALDILYNIDLTYYCTRQEVITGRRLVLFNKSLLTMDEQGTPIVPDDALQSYFQFFSDEASNEVKDYVKEFHPDLNTDKLDAELQLQLNLLSSKVGLGRHYYTTDTQANITATQYVLTTKEESRNIKRQSLKIQHTLQEIILALIEIGVKVLGLNVDTDAKVTVQLRTASVDEIEKEREKDLVAVEKGIITSAEFRTKWYPELQTLEKLTDNGEE